MRAAFLIDGYNLLHAMGVLSGRVGPHGLEKARNRLLGYLRGGFGEEAAEITVVFDAANAPLGADPEQDFRGIHVRFAVQQEDADELIELLIQHDSAPRQLTVISDDHRIQRAARRRDCAVQGCFDFLDWLGRRRSERRRQRQEAPEKSEDLSENETRHWLQEFGDLDDDPDFKWLFDPYDFDRP